MMQTIAATIPPDVFSYVHACDGHVDINLEASIDSDTSEAAPMQQFYAEQEALAAIHADEAAYQPAEYSPEYQDPNAGGDHIPNPEVEAYDVSAEEYAQNPADSGDAALPQEGVILYTDDNRPYTWDASSQSYVYLEEVVTEDAYQAADDAQAEAAVVENASQYPEPPAGGEGEPVYADPAQMQGDGSDYAPTEAADAEGYYAEDGNYYYYATEGHVDPAQYVEEYAAEDGAYGEVAYETPEAVETQVFEAQVPEPVPEPVPAEVYCSPEERQRDLDVAFFGAEQANKVAKRDAEARAIALAQEQARVAEYQDPAQGYTEQSYSEAPVVEQQVYAEGDATAYAYQEGADGYTYDSTAYDSGTYVNDVPADPAVAGAYTEEYQVEGVETYGEQAIQTYEGDALQTYAGEVPQSYESAVAYDGEVPQAFEGEVPPSYEGEVAPYTEEATLAYTGEVPLGYTGEVSQEYLGDVPQEYAGEVLQEYAGEIPQEYAGEVPQEYVGEVPQEYAGEVPQENVEEVPQGYVDEVPQEYVGEALQEYAEEVPQEYSEEVPQEYVDEVPQEYVGEVPQEYAGEVSLEYAGEAAQEYVEEVPQAYSGEADQSEYQEQVGGQYYECGQGYYDAEGNPIGYGADTTYAEQVEVAADAGVAYDGATTEVQPAEEVVEYYDDAGAETLQNAEMTQEQVIYSQQEYVVDKQYDGQQIAVGAEVAVDPSYQEYYTEQTDGTVITDPAYASEAVDVQQYNEQEVCAAVSSEADGAYAAETYETQQSFIAEDGTAVPGVVEYQTENVSQSVEEPYAQSDQGYLSEQANDSAECLIEAAAADQPVAGGEAYAETGPEAQYAEGHEAQFTEGYVPENAQAYDQQYVQEYTAEQLQEYAEQCAALGIDPSSAETIEQHSQECVDHGTYAEQVPQDDQQQQPAEYAEQDPQVCGVQAHVEGESYAQQNGELPQEDQTEPVETQIPNVSPNIVRGKPFTREMDSTEKFKSFQIEYERTPAFDAFGHCLKFLGVRRGFVSSIRANGVVCVQLKGAQLDEWQDTEFEYDPSKPAAKVEVGQMYIIEHSFDGNKYMERCRVKDIKDNTAFIQLIDTGCERTIPKNQLYDIINLEEVERLPPQVVDIFVVGLTHEGYSKEDLERLEMEWNPYEEVFIIPVDAPKGGLIRTIVSRKTGETLGIHAAPQNANKSP